MPIKEISQAGLFKDRRNELVKMIQSKFAESAQGVVLLFGAFETHSVFKQERSFYYLSGVQEPASAFTIDLSDNKSTLYVPNFGTERAKWVAGTLIPGQKDLLGFDEIAYLGSKCKGYQCHPFFTSDEYADLISFVKQCVKEKRSIFTLNPQNASSYVEQRFILQRMQEMIPGLKELIIDISPLVASMRRIKHHQEIEYIYKAIDVTIDAQDAASRAIAMGKKEYEIQAIIEYMFTSRGCSIAFPSIVATGKNGTVLHYNDNNAVMQKGDLVVVDIGAEYNYYNADITRTYPASGIFNKRQKELYLIVLETQQHIADLAKPGMWVSNKEQEDKSLFHLAHKFLKDRGYDHYFPHGIGHYLGLDVHDVGDYSEPLKIGDVITIEPGIYIPEEGIGIRIEDNYWIVEDGNICLSEDLPRQPDDIELMMAGKGRNEEAEESDESDDSFDDDETN